MRGSTRASGTPSDIEENRPGINPPGSDPTNTDQTNTDPTNADPANTGLTNTGLTEAGLTEADLNGVLTQIGQIFLIAEKAETALGLVVQLAPPAPRTWWKRRSRRSRTPLATDPLHRTQQLSTCPASEPRHVIDGHPTWPHLGG